MGYIDRCYDSDAGQIGGNEEKGRDSKDQKEDKILGGGSGNGCRLDGEKVFKESPIPNKKRNPK